MSVDSGLAAVPQLLLVRKLVASNYFSPFYKWFGEMTLEMYLLQFHLLMCRSVQHIIVIIPADFY